jgi:hypothetical protein
MRWFHVFVFLVSFLFSGPWMMAETAPGTNAELEGAFLMRRPLPVEMAKPRIDRLTWTFLAADGGARMLDAYSTHRMLKNRCGAGVRMAGTSTCNYEQNLPGFISNHASGLYSFEGAVWLSEFATTRLLVRHNHRRLARFVPLMDFLSTTSFAVNNLTLSIGDGGTVVAGASKPKSRGLR